MTYNAYFVRKKKPKKPDFEYKGKQFWISNCDCIEMWDGEYGEYDDPLVFFGVLYFDTDKEVNWEKDGSVKLWKISNEIGYKLFPKAGQYLG